MKSTSSRFALFGALVFVLASAAVAQTVMLENAQMQYQVSDYGWSDTWMVPPQPNYSLFADLLSGDDAANVQYRIANAYVSGNGWLTPVLDAGTLGPNHATGSAWVVTTPVAFTNGTIAAESVISQPAHGLRITIDTSINGTVMNQSYKIDNVGNNVITDLLFADYLNLHPDGSSNPSYLNGVVSYVNGSLYFNEAGHLPSYISDAYMHGTTLPDLWGLWATPGLAIPAVEGRLYNLLPGPLGINDVAGALAFRDPIALFPGGSITYRIEKGLGHPTPLPEPSGLLLAALAGVGGLVARKKRRPKGH